MKESFGEGVLDRATFLHYYYYYFAFFSRFKSMCNVHDSGGGTYESMNRAYRASMSSYKTETLDLDSRASVARAGKRRGRGRGGKE
jgi:hypothetical protein